jgi:hypothetical protein
MTRIDSRTLRAYRIFRANGGTPAGSLACARAELNAHALGVYVVWHDDWEVGSHREEYGKEVYDQEPDSCEVAILRDATGEALGSLGCIDDADEHYRRLVSAELFLEYLPAPGDCYSI